MKPEIKLIAADLDGTLLYRGNHILPQNVKAIESAREKGAYFVVATGRAAGLLPRRILPEMDFSITCNGSVVRDERANRVLRISAIPTENVLTALEVIKKYPGMFLEIFHVGQVVLEKCTWKHISEYQVPEFHMDYFLRGEQLVVDSFENFVKCGRAQVTKINMPVSGKMSEMMQRSREGVCRELAETGLFCMASDGAGIELTNRDVSKGHALKILCESLKIEKENVAAFGDNVNDISMLHYAGVSVAMENGNEEAKKAARYITGSNTAGGVAEFLYSNV